MQSAKKSIKKKIESLQLEELAEFIGQEVEIIINPLNQAEDDFYEFFRQSRKESKLPPDYKFNREELYGRE